MKKALILAMALVMLAGFTAYAQTTSVPPSISYQGMLTDAGGSPMTGTKKLTFNIYDAAAGGNLIWGSQVFDGVPLIGGRFNVILEKDTAGRLITSAFGAKERYIGIKVDSNAEISPRQQILTTPFAVQAEKATTVQGANLYVDSTSGNVGVGTTTPGTKLDVSGKVKATNVGSTFIHWGSSKCPQNTELLYSGFGFNGHYTVGGGGAEPICMAPGDPGTPGPGTNYGDLLNPIGTGNLQRMPPGITEMREVKCAECYAAGPSFVVWGTSKCPSGWTPAYTGYGMGAYYSGHGKSNRQCVDNVTFDASVANKTYGDIWYGTVLWSNDDLSTTDYPTNTYVKCSVCVKE